MKNLILQIPIKPLSVNSKFTIANGQRRITKKSGVYVFERQIKAHLTKYADEIRFFVNNMMTKDCLRMEMVTFIPESEFFNKKGTHNLKCIDASNALKIIEDAVYSELGLNDALNMFVSSQKVPVKGEDYSIVITITKIGTPQSVDLDSLRKLATQLDDHSAVKLN